jgi:Nif-specific ferredoxin III
MSALITGRTRGGAEWVPQFVESLDQSRCIGCGRCFKACPRSVFNLVEREADDDADDGFSEDTAMVMSIANLLECVGCQACAKACSKGCLTHTAQSI